MQKENIFVKNDELVASKTNYQFMISYKLLLLRLVLKGVANEREHIVERTSEGQIDIKFLESERP